MGNRGAKYGICNFGNAGTRVSDGVNLKNVSMFSTSWVSGRLTTTSDISGNLV